MTELNQNQMNPRPKPKAPLVLFIVCILVLAIVGGYFAYAKSLGNTAELANNEVTSQVAQSNNTVEDNSATTDTTGELAAEDQNIITYENEGRIYLYNITTKITEEVKLIDEPTKEKDRDYYKSREPMWSPDGRYLAYMNKNYGLIVLDTKLIKQQKLFDFGEDGALVYYYAWSPNSKYITTNFGTSVGQRSLLIYSIEKNKSIGELTVLSSNGVWSADSKKYLSSFPRDIGYERDSAQSSELTSDLVLSDISENGIKSTTLLKGDIMHSYHSYGWTEDGKIRYEKRVYLSEKTSEYSSSYWIYVEGGEDIKTESDPTLNFTQFPAIPNLPEKLPPDPDGNYYNPRLSKGGDWLVYGVSRPQRIYLMRYNKPETAEKIADGQNPSWRPY